MRIRGNSVFKSSEEKREAILKYSVRILADDRAQILKKELYNDYGLDDIQATSFLSEVKEIIAETTAMNNHNIMAVHTDLYEDVYQRFLNLGFTKGALVALERKEKLLDLHREEQDEVVINNQTNVTINDNSYDTSKLSQQQQDRLNHLLNKAKG